MTEINLIKVDSKPLSKLIDVISDGIGILYEPTRIRKNAGAKAYEIEIIERAKSKALAESKVLEAETYDRIKQRFIHKEMQRQANIDSLYEIASEELKNEKIISEEVVSKDWVSRFFDLAQDISDSDVQQLWGKILAEEIKEPKSFSLRTIELLRNLSKHEANLFTKVAQLAMGIGIKPYFICPINENGQTAWSFGYPMSDYNISRDEIKLLEELGLLQNKQELIMGPFDTFSDRFIAGNFVMDVKRHSDSFGFNIPCLFFTTIGNQLLKLVEIAPPIGYLNAIAKRIEEEGNEVYYAKFDSDDIKNNHNIITSNRFPIK